MPITVIAGPVIAAGQSLSSAVDCTLGVPAMLIMPADWTDAICTFQVSEDNATFSDLFSNAGGEVTANVVPGTAILLEYGWMRGVVWLKVRSGTRSEPIIQTAQRNFILVLEKA